MMRRVIILLLVFLSILSLVIRFGSLITTQFLGLKDRAGVRIDANNTAQVLINNQPVGQTPFQKEDLTAGEQLITLKTDTATWQGYVKLNTGTLTVVNRDLEPTEASSAGEIITLEKGSGATVLSNPSDTGVQVDGQDMGKTPVSLSNLKPGEHIFLLSHPSYVKRSIRATSVLGYDLTLSVDLALSQADLTQDNSPPVVQPVQLTVKQTPTGYLNIRSQASVTSQQVGQIPSGDTVTLLEELPSWDRIRTSDGTEGYVFSSYVGKKSQ